MAVECYKQTNKWIIKYISNDRKEICKHMLEKSINIHKCIKKDRWHKCYNKDAKNKTKQFYKKIATYWGTLKK